MVVTLLDQRMQTPTVDIHIKEMPAQVYRIAKGAATMCNMPVAKWVALAILEKWDKEKNG